MNDRPDRSCTEMPAPSVDDSHDGSSGALLGYLSVLHDCSSLPPRAAHLRYKPRARRGQHAAHRPTTIPSTNLRDCPRAGARCLDTHRIGPMPDDLYATGASGASRHTGCMHGWFAPAFHVCFRSNAYTGRLAVVGAVRASSEPHASQPNHSPTAVDVPYGTPYTSPWHLRAAQMTCQY